MALGGCLGENRISRRPFIVKGLVERQRRELAFGLTRQLHQFANAGDDLVLDGRFQDYWEARPAA
jgi:hypothetical protein